MKIVKLTAENIKRLTAVEISPEGNVVTIGGKNGAGKSSVLDSIAYALGGRKLVPPQPIRKGQKQASIEVVLDDFIVTRTFHLVPESCSCFSNPHEEDCDFLKLKPALQSTLEVRSVKDGTKFSSPQAMLDKLMGKLSFDPIAFMKYPEGMAEQLKEMVGLDFSDLEEKRNLVHAQKGSLNKGIAELEMVLGVVPFHPDIQGEAKDLSKITQRFTEAEKARKEYGALNRSLQDTTGFLAQWTGEHNDSSEKIRVLQGELLIMEEKLEKLGDEKEKLEKVIAKFNQPESIELITKELADAQKHNERLRDNKSHLKTKKRWEEVVREVEDKDEALRELQKEKQRRLSRAKYPIKGLKINADGIVEYKGVPVEQASTAEQLRIAVAIGLALNPKLKILLIRDGNALDSDSLREVAQQAAEADAQLWLERVAETKDGVSVMIEEGKVV